VLKSLLSSKVEARRRPRNQLPQLACIAKLSDTTDRSFEVRLYERACPPIATKKECHIDPMCAGASVTSTLTTWPIAKINGQGTDSADFAC
jgi:hypothetical protein